MKTYLVTGAAGFIGANYIKYLLHRKYKDEEMRIIVLDLLTYAGNLGTIKDDIDNDRCIFVRGDIRDRELADNLFAKYDIDFVVNFLPRVMLTAVLLIRNSSCRPISSVHRICLMLPARLGLLVAMLRDILHGNRGNAIIRFRPMKCTAR